MWKNILGFTVVALVMLAPMRDEKEASQYWLRTKTGRQLKKALMADRIPEFLAALDKNKDRYGIVQTVNDVLQDGVLAHGKAFTFSRLLNDRGAGFLRQVICPSVVSFAADHLLARFSDNERLEGMRNLEAFVDRCKFYFEDKPGINAETYAYNERDPAQMRLVRIEAAFYRSILAYSRNVALGQNRPGDEKWWSPIPKKNLPRPDAEAQMCPVARLRRKIAQKPSL